MASICKSMYFKRCQTKTPTRKKHRSLFGFMVVLSTGHWSYCPVICRSLQNRGFAIVQVEYRTSQRFDGTPLTRLLTPTRPSIDDRQRRPTQSRHAKLMVAGFQAAAHWPLPAIFNSDKVKGLPICSGGFDPANDTWYNSGLDRFAIPKKLSPLRMVHAKSPPQIIFHAKDDEMCCRIAMPKASSRSSRNIRLTIS